MILATPERSPVMDDNYDITEDLSDYDDYSFDEGSDLDNWETEQVFQDTVQEAEDAGLEAMYEERFEYEDYE